MQVVSVCVLTLITVVAGAPSIINSIPDYLKDRQIDQFRDKRHKIGHGFYTPIGAASSQQISYLPYQYNLRPYVNPYAYSNCGYQSSYNGCGHSGYMRAEEREDDREMSDLDQDHTPNRHTAEAAASASNPQLSASNLASIGQLVTPSSGPAYGIFPNVPSGGCNVPLLFSCAPTIVPGRITRGSSQFGYGGIPFGYNAYRDVEDFAYEPHLQEQSIHESAPTGDATQVTKQK